MIRTTLSIAALGVMAAPAFAQELTYGAFSLDYSTFSSNDGGGEELTNFDLEGDAEFTIDQFVLGAGISSDNFDSDGGFDGTIRILDVYAGYAITPEVLVGAGFANTTIDFFGDEDFSGYDVFGQYQTGGFGVAINYSRPDDEFDEFEITTLFAQGEVAPGVTVGGFVESYSEVDESAYFLSAEYDAGQIFGRAYYTSVTDTDFGLYGLRGAYRFDDAISITGGVEALSGDDFFGEYTAVSIGGEYQFAPGVAATARYTNIDVDGGSGADGFAIGLTYEMGARKRLDLNMMDDAMTDMETGIFGVQPNAGTGLLFGGFGPI